MTQEKQGKEAIVMAEEKATGQDLFASFDFSKLEMSMEEMFKSGVHFGHNKSRKNPKMNEYIFGIKNGINIFDLQKTIAKLKEATDFISQMVASGQDILFVGTKKQARRLVQSAAINCEMPYVIERWLGGTFTNFGVIAKRTRFLREGQEKIKKGDYSQYTKFEQMKIVEELEKMEKKMGGIKNMTKLPGAIFVIGAIEDELAIKEARKKNIPVVAIADSNINPQLIDFIIPGNDDAISSIKFILAHVIKAVMTGKAKRVAVEKTASPANAATPKNKSSK